MYLIRFSLNQGSTVAREEFLNKDSDVILIIRDFFQELQKVLILG